MKKLLACIIAILTLSTCAQKAREVAADAAPAVTENQTATEDVTVIPSPPPAPDMQGQEVVITTDAELRFAIDELIIKGNLSEEQKSELYDLRVELGQGLERNTVLNVKLRSLLVQEMMSENGSQQGVNMIGDMIHKNITERITMIERSIEKVNSILGFQKSAPPAQHNTQHDFF